MMGFSMEIRRFALPWKAFAALLAAVCLVSFSFAAVSPALAADPAPAPPPAPGGTQWETWPQRPAAAGVVEPAPPGPAAAGEAGGDKTSTGISSGTWKWIAGIVAAGALIGVAAGGGGGGSTTVSHH